jgi:hypothetical protein
MFEVGAGPVPARLPIRANQIHNNEAKNTCPYGQSGWHRACPYFGQLHSTFFSARGTQRAQRKNIEERVSKRKLKVRLAFRLGFS